MSLRKTIKLLIALVVLAFIAMATAGILKFNFYDVPYQGDPIVYKSHSGEQFEAHFKTNRSVEVRFMHDGENYLKVFAAEPVRSASGAKYKSKKGRFVFWSKGNEASIFNHNNELIITGTFNSTAKSEERSEFETSRVESIYFSEKQNKWLDQYGECHTCTIENGFGINGVVDDIAWRELHIGLTNDLDESPSTEEVRAFFATYYADQTGLYPVYVKQEDNRFEILLAVPKSSKDINFFDRRGALLATYEVNRNP